MSNGGGTGSGDATVVEYAASMRMCQMKMADGSTLQGMIIKGATWQICSTKDSTGGWTGCTTFDPANVVSIKPLA
ncbi:MAG TPA: hypothetical protein VEV38_04545 [Candidatus Eremiobacteraceae bacterium]|nr:hypothetical protein [Candidatus Eremiobacteraceae bacterium]